MNISRKSTGIGIGIVALAIICGVAMNWYLNPDRSLARSWAGFIYSIEDRDAGAVAAYLDKDYSDSWGYSQATLTGDLRRIMYSFKQLKLTLDDVTVTRDGSEAIITARVKMSANGYGYVDDAMRQVNGLTDPFVLRWKRKGAMSSGWTVVRIEQPKFDASRYGPRKHGFSF